MTNFAFRAFAVALVTMAIVPCVQAERNAIWRLDFAFRMQSDRALPNIEALRELHDRKQAIDIVKQGFNSNWISTRGKMSLIGVERVADAVGAFGSGYTELPRMILNNGGLPAAAGEDSFITWLRNVLPQRSVATELLPVLGLTQKGSPEVVNRLRFLQRIARQAEAGIVSTFFDEHYWQPATVAESATFFVALGENPLPGWGQIRVQLAEQVYSKPVVEWPNAEDTLLSMAAATHEGVRGFLHKATERLRSTPGERSDKTSAMITLLARAQPPLVGAQTVGLTERECPLDWFLWCHNTKPLIEHFLQNNEAVRAMTARLIAFCAPDDDQTFSQVFALVCNPYYQKIAVRNNIFDELLFPKATRAATGAGLVLEAALRGEWSTEHRNRLGLLVLPEGRADEPAWQPDGKLRLETASTIYQGLEDKDPQEHVGRPLLKAVLLGHLGRFVRASDSKDAQAEDRAVEGLSPLIAHLGGCRNRGANLSRCSPLNDFRERLSASALECFNALSHHGDNSEVVQRFVRRFKVALRVDRLLARLDGPSGDEPPPWVKTVCAGLRTRVFGLPEELNGRVAQQPAGVVVRWDSQTLAYRADLLCELALDQDFRTVLGASSMEQLVFEEILLPLVRVEGLVELLQERRKAPHAAWCGSNSGRWVAVFAALDTAESLTAPKAVKAFASLHLASLGVNSPWLAKGKQFFAGRWSVNANFAVFRDMLAETPPGGSDIRSRRADLQDLTSLAVQKWSALPNDAAWNAAGWLEHLICAQEWQCCPFVTREGEIIPWDKPVSNRRESPFLFEFPEAARYGSRKVNGHLRMAFSQSLLALARQPLSAERLELLSDACTMLPNSDANDSSADSGCSGDAPKIEAARLVYRALADAGSKRVDILRSYMRLGAALTRPAGGAADPQGALPPDLPSAWDLLANAHDASSLEMVGLREELRRLLISREQASQQMPKELLRRDIDGMLGTKEKQGSLLACKWSAIDRDLLGQSYGARLKQIGEPTVRDFLTLRRSVLTLLNLAEPRTPDPGAPVIAKTGGGGGSPFGAACRRRRAGAAFFRLRGLVALLQPTGLGG